MNSLLYNDFQNIENIIDKRLSFSYYHKLLFLIVALILLADGSEALSLSLMLPCVINEYSLDSGSKKLLSSIYYLGVLIGALSGGVLSDKYGRKQIFIITTFLTGLLGFATFIIENFQVFLTIRFLFGIVIGIVSPLSVSIITESFPSKIRGMTFILCRVGKMIGELFASFMAIIFLEDDLKSGNWRALLLVSALPAFISFVLAYNYLIETPRYYLAKQDFDNSNKCFSEIYKINEIKYEDFNQQEVNLMDKFYSDKNFEDSLINRLKILFNEKNKTITILVWILWCCYNIVFYGSTFILPLIIAKLPKEENNETFISKPITKIIMPILAEIPAAFICSYIIDHPMFGRKLSILLSLIFPSFAYLLCFFSSQEYFIYFLVIARFFLVLGYSIKYTFTSEVYHTQIRSTAVGAASGMGRIGAILMPIVLISSLEISINLPFLALCFVCLIGAVAVYYLPYDTHGRILDVD